MNTQHLIDLGNGEFRLVLPIGKVDKDARTVSGVATAEILDSHGDIVDFATAKPVFEKWRGNIREMHQPKAVGKRVGMTFDEGNSAILVDSYVSKGAPDTWEKVCDGTLAMYSIGAKGYRKPDPNVKKADGTPASRVYLTEMGELSLVDSGACPIAKFEIVKMDGADLVDPQPADPEEAPAAEATPAAAPAATTELPKGAVLGAPAILKAILGRGGFVLDRVTAAGLAPVMKQIADGEEPIVKRLESYDIRNALQALAYLNELVASEFYEATCCSVCSYYIPPGKSACERDGCAGTPADSRAQLETLKDAGELLLAFLTLEYLSQFREFEAANVEGESGTVMALADTPQRKGARVLGAATIAKAFEDARPVAFHAIDTTGQVVYFTKKGARHSKADNEMLQAMHDYAYKLGAVCQCEETKEASAVVPPESSAGAAAAAASGATPVHTPAAASPDAPPAAAPLTKTTTPPEQELVPALQAETITKLTTMLDEANTLLSKAKETAAAQQDVISKLEGRVKTLEDQPMPGGPLARPTEVHKQLGNTVASGAESVTPDVVNAVVAKLAEGATNDAERAQLATLLIKHQHATGDGARVISAVPQRG